MWPYSGSGVYWRQCESCWWIEIQEPHRQIKEERRQRLRSIRNHYDPDTGYFTVVRHGLVQYLTANEFGVTEEDVKEVIREEYLARKGN
jgi:hypothetical protein